MERALWQRDSVRQCACLPALNLKQITRLVQKSSVVKTKLMNFYLTWFHLWFALVEEYFKWKFRGWSQSSKVLSAAGESRRGLMWTIRTWWQMSGNTVRGKGVKVPSDGYPAKGCWKLPVIKGQIRDRRAVVSVTHHLDRVALLHSVKFISISRCSTERA